MSNYWDYDYHVHWSDGDQEYIATVDGFPSLSWSDPDPIRAVEGLIQMVRAIIEDLEGEPDPEDDE